jgi:hypothetical protein
MKLNPRRPVLERLILIGAGSLAGLLLTEGTLRLLGLPRFYRAHSAPAQFSLLENSTAGPLYVNIPSMNFRFVYDGNPRGYFGPQNEVDHQVNSAGFRGPEFAREKPARNVRIAFLGDSFTFGEGVRLADTYPEVAAGLLNERNRDRGIRFESYNFSVGGYNTRQELEALRAFALPFQPDIVIVGYTLNDAEPALFARNPLTGQPERRARELDVPEGLGDAQPPNGWFWKLRSARLGWQIWKSRQQTRQTVNYYHRLYAPEAIEWQITKTALRQLAAECSSRDIPCCIAVFPVLYDLGSSYPFADLHRMVGEEISRTSAIGIDLLPKFRGQKAAALCVHPTDQHPNEVAHRMAAQAIVEALMADSRFQQKLKERGQ